MDHVLYKGTILQRNYRKMTISWSLSYNSFVKFTRLCYIPTHVVMRCAKELHCISIGNCISPNCTKVLSDLNAIYCVCASC